MIEEECRTRFVVNAANIVHWQETILLFFHIKPRSDAVWALRKEDVHPQVDRAVLVAALRSLQMGRW